MTTENDTQQTTVETPKAGAAKAGKAKKIAPVAANDPNRRVKVKLFKDNDKYKEPLFVRVNSYTALIPRGVQVEIPYYVAKHIEETQQQDANTAMLVEELGRGFAAMEKAGL